MLLFLTMRILKAILFAAVVSACSGSGSVRYTARAEVTTPQLVEVEPGVRVVADYDEPVFYNDGFYWRYYGGVWYRSPYYNRSWVRVSTVPVAVRRIERPELYVHYRAGARVAPVRVYSEERREELRERRDERQEAHDQRELARDRAEIRHDQRELARDRREIREDRAEGDRRELARDRRELKRDQREMARDKKEHRDDRRQARRRH